MDANATAARVAFIGLGMMGYPMAGRLATCGFPLAVFDLSPDAMQRFSSERSCRVCSSAAAAAKDADIVITMLPSSSEVFATVLGSESAPGIVSVLKSGAIVIDMSSSDPLRTRELAKELVEHGITLVDAPVSGAVKRAKEGTLAIMFGGSAESLARCRSVLEKIGTSIFHTGAVGTGHAMKALNNYVSAAGLVAAVEALHVGKEFGLDPKVMTQVMNASTGKNNATENKVTQFMLSGAFNSGFSLPLMSKDIGIAIHLADELEVEAQLGHTCLDIWRNAAGQSEKTTDHTEMYRILDSK